MYRGVFAAINLVLFWPLRFAPWLAKAVPWIAQTRFKKGGVQSKVFMQWLRVLLLQSIWWPISPGKRKSAHQHKIMNYTKMIGSAVGEINLKIIKGASEFPNFRIPEFPNFRISEFLNFRISEFPNFRISEFPNFRISEFPNFRISEFPNVSAEPGWVLF